MPLSLHLAAKARDFPIIAFPKITVDNIIKHMAIYL